MFKNRIIYHQRASTILYNILLSQGDLEKYYLIPSNVCPIVICVFLKAGKNFELVDITPDDLCIDQQEVLRRIQAHPEKYNGLLFVRTYGLECDASHFFAQIKSENESFLVVDDACLATPQLRQENTVADIELFSTGYSKYADLGYGGYAFLADSVKYGKHKLPYLEREHLHLQQMLNDAIVSKTPFQYTDSPWLNTENPEWESGEYLNKVMEEKAASKKIKDELNAYYSTHLPIDIQLGSGYQNWRYNILVPAKDLLLKKIFKQGLFASSHYYPASQLFRDQQANYTECLYNHVVNLFNDKRFDLPRAKQLVEIILEHILQYKKSGEDQSVFDQVSIQMGLKSRA
jgi:hypothetical protein